METERPCPICNGSGRAQHRGFTTPCHHCAATRVATLETQRCPECGRARFRGDGTQDDDVCFGQIDSRCPAVTVARLKSELALARKALAAAKELRGWQTTAPPSVVEAFDAAMAEVRKGEAR